MPPCRRRGAAKGAASSCCASVQQIPPTRLPPPAKGGAPRKKQTATPPKKRAVVVAPNAAEAAQQEDRKAAWAAKQAEHDEWRRSIGLKPVMRKAPKPKPPDPAPEPDEKEELLPPREPPQARLLLTIAITLIVPLLCAGTAYSAAYSVSAIIGAYLLPLGAIFALLIAPISDNGDDGDERDDTLVPSEGALPTDEELATALMPTGAELGALQPGERLRYHPTSYLLPPTSYLLPPTSLPRTPTRRHERGQSGLMISSQVRCFPASGCEASARASLR